MIFDSVVQRRIMVCESIEIFIKTLTSTLLQKKPVKLEVSMNTVMIKLIGHSRWGQRPLRAPMIKLIGQMHLWKRIRSKEKHIQRTNHTTSDNMNNNQTTSLLLFFMPSRASFIIKSPLPIVPLSPVSS